MTLLLAHYVFTAGFAAPPSCDLPAILQPGVTNEQIALPADPKDLPAWRDGLAQWRASCRAAIGYTGKIYDQPALNWTSTSYIQPQSHPYDRLFYDVASHSYTMDVFLADLTQRYGGIDSVLVWPTYTNIGMDDRNQFDLIRAMPGGAPPPAAAAAAAAACCRRPRARAHTAAAAAAMRMSNAKWESLRLSVRRTLVILALNGHPPAAAAAARPPAARAEAGDDEHDKHISDLVEDKIIVTPRLPRARARPAAAAAAAAAAARPTDRHPPARARRRAGDQEVGGRAAREGGEGALAIQPMGHGDAPAGGGVGRGGDGEAARRDRRRRLQRRHDGVGA